MVDLTGLIDQQSPLSELKSELAATLAGTGNTTIPPAEGNGTSGRARIG